ncbi:fungal-specific transcription factor domain-containing protein [Exophiala viscosa]|uniref:Fungal-specific transcription factor domain-containing protein n=1 Tax=Exophiala viscosa TaxID=2486360 RepID=A0AAN6DR28_9EURO|nr:fungal-specific transcription factor domain-containing protein [Exophiala viscosa]
MQHNHSLWYKTACWTCRDRKVKCDKVLPCRNCSLAGIVCSYPPQVRTVRRPKRAHSTASPKQDDALLDRITKLEALLKKQSSELHINGVNDGQDSSVAEPHAEHATAPQSRHLTNATSLVGHLPTNAGLESTTAPVDTAEPFWKISPEPGALGPQQGVASDTADANYWERIEEQCASQVFLKSPSVSKTSIRSDAYNQEPPNSELPSIAFPFHGPSSPAAVPLLPMPERLVCWRKYLENVDPILKILHKSTTQTLLLLPDDQCYTLDSPSRALIQAICLLAVTSMSESDVSAGFSRSKESMTRKCAALTEQALMAAKFLEAQDLTTIQALLLFLYYLRCMEDPRLNALCGMAIFLAVRAGLNRDGAASGLPYLEVELRRRTWWQLLNLVDHPDDSGLENFPPGMGADTQLPRNVNDSELDFQMGDATEERVGFTESSFCLMQYEVTRTFNLIKSERARASAGREFRTEEAEQLLHSSREVFRQKYFQGQLKEAPIGEFAADVIAMVLAKRRLLMHISPDRHGHGESVTPDAQNHLFMLAVHVLELSRSLQTNKSAERWRWLSATYFQWSIAAFVARNLTIRPSSPATKRAWHVMDGILDLWPLPMRNSTKANALKGLIADAMRNRDAQNPWLSMWSGSNTAQLPSPPIYRKPPSEDKRIEKLVHWSDPMSELQQPPPVFSFNQGLGSDNFGSFNFNFDELNMDFGLLS